MIKSMETAHISTMITDLSTLDNTQMILEQELDTASMLKMNGDYMMEFGVKILGKQVGQSMEILPIILEILILILNTKVEELEYMLTRISMLENGITIMKMERERCGQLMDLFMKEISKVEEGMDKDLLLLPINITILDSSKTMNSSMEKLKSKTMKER